MTPWERRLALDRERRLARLDGQWITDSEAERRLNALPTRTPAPAQRKQMQLERRQSQLDGIDSKERSLGTLVAGLRAGTLDPADLEERGCVEFMMLRSTGRTAAEVRAMVGATTGKARNVTPTPTVARATARFDGERR